MNFNKFFDWNSKAWSFAFLSLINKSNLNFKNILILEIGATVKSSVGMFFHENNNLILSSNNLKEIILMKKIHKSNSVDVVQLDLLNLVGKYDLIIMKSVLGGLCRVDGEIKANQILNKIKENNLKEGGAIISLDNGKPIFHKIIQYFQFGARKNKWFFFKVDHLTDFEAISTFGFLSFFSLKTRIGHFGKIIEYFMYITDRIIFIFYKKNPTIIVKYFKKNLIP